MNSVTKFILYSNVAMLSSNQLYGQDTIKVAFESNLLVLNTGSVEALYKLKGNTILYDGIEYHVSLPEDINTEELAFFVDYYDGWKNPAIGKVRLCL
jgi:hypothetical protein